jgi:hypothetical protein
MWDRAQDWEADWWGNCTNTLGEETKQVLYAQRMGLEWFHDGKSPFNIDMGGKSVLDIGGGPCSILLKCRNVIGTVADPLSVPPWVKARYRIAKVELLQVAAEELKAEIGGVHFDECWIYNVLQHTQDPRIVIEQAGGLADLIRIFEWIDTPTNVGHPHALSEDMLNELLGGIGKTELLKGQNACYGKCYYGIFSV